MIYAANACVYIALKVFIRISNAENKHGATLLFVYHYRLAVVSRTKKKKKKKKKQCFWVVYLQKGSRDATH